MRVAVCVLAIAMVGAGCATHRNAFVSSRAASGGQEPRADTFASTLESSDEHLKTALARLATVPTAEAHRRVAVEYRRLGVLDAAHEHFTAAVELSPTDAMSYDALARIWRDWGIPTMAMADARRAVFYAPRSAVAANTLGTVFQALGDFAEAKRWYAQAVSLDPAAWYALNNLCYAEILGHEANAIDACRRAVASAPTETTAHNNLALAYAAVDDMIGAKQWFQRAGDPAITNYNLGIVMMSRHAYREAQHAFQAALLADPESTLAASRAREARLAAGAQEHTQ